MFTGEFSELNIMKTWLYISDCGVYYWLSFDLTASGQVTDWENLK